MGHVAWRWAVAATALGSISLGAAAMVAEVTVAQPESGQALQALVDEGRLAGVSTLVSRHGAIVMAPAKANAPRGKNSFYWRGAFGTWFWIDPTNGSIPTGNSPPMRTLSPRMVYATLADTTR